MQFRIADTFTASLARLTGEEQKAVKTTAFDLQMNPAHPAHSLHKLDKARDKAFWSARVSRDLRLIVHRAGDSFLLCYVAHHDDAYHWAERRRLETHPTTGAAQWVEIRQRVEEQPGVQYANAIPKLGIVAPLAHLPDADLLGWGVPADWLQAVRDADEEALLDVAAHLPAEAAEAILTLAVGGTPSQPAVAKAGADPFEHPDAQRRFRTMADMEALEQALAFPWDRWTVFLHPAQRQWVERAQNGPARVSGSAGTGKTIVALHRAVHLARTRPEARVWLTTLTPTLANALRTRMRRLVGSSPQLAERIDVVAIDEEVERLSLLLFGPTRMADGATLAGLVAVLAADTGGLPFDAAFLANEWSEVVDAWSIDSWEVYKGVRRLGRKARLSEARRRQCWDFFIRLRESLADRSLTTMGSRYAKLAAHYAGGAPSPFQHIVVDEAQDLSIPQLRLLAAMTGSGPDGLFFAGDLGQRIFQQPFSWKALGVDVRGRAKTLTVNYRTSHQIRAQADALLGPEIADVDGLVERRRGTVSVFNGPVPTVEAFPTVEDEVAAVAKWLRECVDAGFAPGETAVFVRGDPELGRAKAAITAAGLPFHLLDAWVDTDANAVAVGNMHLAKGLEFRAVAVMACDDEVVPSQPRIDEVIDAGDLAEVYASERHLLYVACTRARDRLWVSGVEPVSEFLADLEGERGRKPWVEAETEGAALSSQRRPSSRSESETTQRRLSFEHNEFGRPEIPNIELRGEDIPPPGAPLWKGIDDFALTFDGYRRHPDNLFAIVGRAMEKFRESGRLPVSLSKLRACLFCQQRAWKDSAEEPDRDSMAFVHAVVEAIRKKVEAGKAI